MGIQIVLIGFLLLAGLLVLLFGSLCSSGLTARTEVGHAWESSPEKTAPRKSIPLTSFPPSAEPRQKLPLPPAVVLPPSPLIPEKRKAETPAEVSFQEQTLLDSINQARRENGLSALATDAGLMNVAREWALYLAPTRSIFHRTSADLGVQRTQCQLGLISENLFASTGPFEAREIVVGWLNSPPHRKALLDASSTLQGVGLAPMPGGGFVAVFNGGG